MSIKSRSSTDVFFYFIVYTLVIIAFFITLYPFVYIMSVSISDPIAVNRGEVFLWPVGFSLKGYKQVLKSGDIWVSYGNTIYYTIVGTIFNMIATVLAAYPLSRKTFCARRFLNFFIVFVMYFSGGLIPTYLLINNIGLYNSGWVMIIPGLVSSYNVMICQRLFLLSRMR